MVAIDRTQQIGLLLSAAEWGKIKRGKSHEKVHLYVAAAKKYNIKVVFFRLQDISFSKSTVRGHYKQGKKWVVKRTPLPLVIHNRARFAMSKKAALRKLRRKGVYVYNGWNRYGKWKIHRLLSNGFAEHMPVTRPFSRLNLIYFLRFSSFFLKPNDGSVGIGIIKVNKMKTNRWQVVSQHRAGTNTKQLTKAKLMTYLTRYAGKRKYLLQQTIPLLTYRQSPFDIRVSVQKNSGGEWQVTGMVAKIARKRRFLSNVAQGGKVRTLEKVLSGTAWDADTVKNQLSNLSLEMARYLEHKLPNLADVGFDFGLDRNGHPWFIEMNNRDQRYSFKLAKMYKTFKKTYENPIIFGHYMLTRKKFGVR